MSTTSSSGGGMSTEPFVWVIIPLIAVFSVGTFIAFVWNRHRRRRNPDRHAWPEDRVLVGSAYVRYRRGMRWSPWSETRSMEGLNELGEAPPPYDTKKPPAIQDRHGRRRDAGEEGTELRDLEAGGRPPEYPAHPPPAVTTDRRAS